MAIATRSRRDLDKAWEAYTAIVDSHVSEQSHSQFSRDDFTTFMEVFASSFPEDTLGDAKKSGAMVRRVMGDVSIVFRGTPNANLRASDFKSLILALRSTVRTTKPEDENPFVREAAAFLLEMDDSHVTPTLQIVSHILTGLGQSLQDCASEKQAKETWGLAAHIIDVEMSRWGLHPDVATLNPLLDLAGRTLLTSTAYIDWAGQEANTAQLEHVSIEDLLLGPRSTITSFALINGPLDAPSFLSFFRDFDVAELSGSLTCSMSQSIVVFRTVTEDCLFVPTTLHLSRYCTKSTLL
ncbi:hypothetical protein M427DRAFT_72577 [Gonapodya prolifera JEL478]|uniref:Uncharacterized protein n=1 Tax=Gonapodya prolifera (strain JEL478) TaxID=1344416 RepID=A0A139A507_GONPJ|nr:hypothetical protein M427DRAFT_72577 [Gonapodya prolifera JEL478]|eukprot:KXS11824.1 hypothetical protein M427DRAFT_72577 [Gonapodya prolifera JEL478]